MPKSKSNSEDSFEVYTDEEIKLLDKYLEYTNSQFEDQELYDIFLRFNFDEDKIKEELDLVLKDMKKGREYQWHDPNEKKKDIIQPPNQTYTKFSRQKGKNNKYFKKNTEHTNKNENNNTNTNTYHPRNNYYSYRNNYYKKFNNKNYNYNYGRKYYNNYNNNNNNKKDYNNNLVEVDLKEEKDTPKPSPKIIEVKNEVQREEKVIVEPVPETNNNIEIEQAEKEVTTNTIKEVKKPSKSDQGKVILESGTANNIEDESSKPKEQEEPAKVPKKEKEVVFEIYENTAFTLKREEPQKKEIQPQVQYQQQAQPQSNFQPQQGYFYPFMYPSFYNMMMAQGNAGQEPSSDQQRVQPQFQYYNYPYYGYSPYTMSTEQARSYMMGMQK